jgi:SagB-type dehydrogenase family enzyme
VIPLDDPTSLSLLFHLNSEPWLNDEAYKSGSASQEFKRPAGIMADVPLPVPAPSALGDLLHQRRSCRAFAVREMPLHALSALLAAAYGIVEADSSGNQVRFLRRSVPSAGGLFPLELYAFARRVDGVTDGLYHYDVLGHSLQQLSCGDLIPSLEPSLYTYPFVCDANVILMLAAVFKRNQEKYGPRGYRYILIEAGHSGQNVCLRAAELGLSTLCMGGFVDSQLIRVLGLHPKREGVIYSVAIGYARGSGE